MGQKNEARHSSHGPMPGKSAFKRSSRKDVELVQDYSALPAVYAKVPTAAKRKASRGSTSLRYYQNLPKARALLRQPQVEAVGVVGQGTAIAIVDSGVDYTHDAFGACSAPGMSAGGQPCRVVESRDFGRIDGDRDDNGHGTAVAGVAAAMAPGADIISLDVFRPAFGGVWYATTQDIVASLNWVVANAAQYNIAAVNLSLGSSPLSGTACQNAMSSLFQQLWQLDIAPVVASGNTGEVTGVMTPACDANAVSVAATYDDSTGENITYVACSDECASQCFCEKDAFNGGGRVHGALLQFASLIRSSSTDESNTGPNRLFCAWHLSRRRMVRPAVRPAYP